MNFSGKLGYILDLGTSLGVSLYTARANKRVLGIISDYVLAMDAVSVTYLNVHSEIINVGRKVVV